MVDYATRQSTATEDSDYLRTRGALTFPASSAAPQEIRVPIIEDAEKEGDEISVIELSSASNAVVGTARATRTILDVDAESGQILTKGRLDFENKRGYAVIVRAVRRVE